VAYHPDSKRTKSILFYIGANTQFTRELKPVIKRSTKLNRTGLIVMLITINISFCLLSMPMSVLQIFYYSHANSIEIDAFSKISSNEKKYSESFLELIEFLHALAEFLQFCNHSSNFFLYSLSGKTFRNETKKFLIQNCVFVKNLFKKN
jgi:hypothetical protein